MYLNLEKKDINAYAIIDDSNQKITYGELVLEINQFKKNLNSNRNLVFILSRNSIGSLFAYLSSYENHDVSLLLNEKIGNEILMEFIYLYSPKYIWVPSNWEFKKDFTEVYRKYDYILLDTGLESPDLNLNLSFLLPTSGSTGSPKLVRHKYGNLESNAKTVSKMFDWDDKERSICDLPMHYTMGLNVINSTLYSGGTVLLCSRNLMDKDFWKFVKAHKATNFTGVPYSYSILFRLRFHEMELPNLRTYCQGGGKLDELTFKNLVDFTENKNLRFFATFGTTETSARLSYLRPEKAKNKIGSIGKTIPNGEMFLVDENKQIIESSSAHGELVYKGPNVTMGYAYKKEDLSLGDTFNGVYFTGDLAFRDDEGFYFIEGRVSRFVKLFGHRVDLDECERILKKTLNIESACIGNDTVVVLFVEQEDNFNNIKKILSNITSLPISCFKVERIDLIPRKDNMKIDYNYLQKNNIN
ncbi:MAG: AMP-binding protein [Bacillota bacterium]